MIKMANYGMTLNSADMLKINGKKTESGEIWTFKNNSWWCLLGFTDELGLPDRNELNEWCFINNTDFWIFIEEWK